MNAYSWMKGMLIFLIVISVILMLLSFGFLIYFVINKFYTNFYWSLGGLIISMILVIVLIACYFLINNLSKRKNFKVKEMLFSKPMKIEEFSDYELMNKKLLEFYKNFKIPNSELNENLRNSISKKTNLNSFPKSKDIGFYDKYENRDFVENKTKELWKEITEYFNNSEKGKYYYNTENISAFNNFYKNITELISYINIYNNFYRRYSIPSLTPLSV